MKVRDEFLSTCQLFRQEFSRLELVEESVLVCSSNISDKLVESHLLAYELQFEVCSGLFNLKRERKVLFLAFMRQQLLLRNTNDKSAIPSKTNNGGKEQHTTTATSTTQEKTHTSKQLQDDDDNSYHDKKRGAALKRSPSSSLSPNNSRIPGVVNDAAEKYPLRHSCGRTQEALNKSQIGHSHGMFASFGNQEFCFRKKHGCIEISHLIVNNNHSSNNNDFKSKKTFQFWIKRGKTNLNLNCGRALLNNQPIPIFYNPRKEDMCIYYVGHWKPLLVEEIPTSKDFAMYVILEFDNFDDALARALTSSSSSSYSSNSVKQEEEVVVKEEEKQQLLQEEQLVTHFSRRGHHNYNLRNSKRIAASLADDDEVQQQEDQLSSHSTSHIRNSQRGMSKVTTCLTKNKTTEEACAPFLHNRGIRHSCGRTRKDLNKFRVGHSFGMFATFGNQEFCFRKKGGTIQISHVIVNDSFSDNTSLQFRIKRGKTDLNLNCGRALSKLNKPIPVFYDPRNADMCVYYVGHWKPFTAKEVRHSKEFAMYVSLEFDFFDDIIARNMSSSSYPNDDGRTGFKEVASASVLVKEEEQLQNDQLAYSRLGRHTNGHRRNPMRIDSTTPTADNCIYVKEKEQLQENQFSTRHRCDLGSEDRRKTYIMEEESASVLAEEDKQMQEDQLACGRHNYDLCRNLRRVTSAASTTDRICVKEKEQLQDVQFAHSRHNLRRNPTRIATSTASTADGRLSSSSRDKKTSCVLEACHHAYAPLQERGIRHSCGRTREDLNRLRLGHSHGMFASFGNQEFCFRKRDGCIQISHLITTDFSKPETLQFWIKRGKTDLNVNCGRTLDRMDTSIPVFYGPREDDSWICYVGHWKPLPLTAKEFRTSNCKEFAMYITLEFDFFDDTLARAMSATSDFEDEGQTFIKAEEFVSTVKEDEQLEENVTGSNFDRWPQSYDISCDTRRLPDPDEHQEQSDEAEALECQSSFVRNEGDGRQALGFRLNLLRKRDSSQCVALSIAAEADECNDAKCVSQKKKRKALSENELLLESPFLTPTSQISLCHSCRRTRKQLNELKLGDSQGAQKYLRKHCRC